MNTFEKWTMHKGLFIALIMGLLIFFALSVDVSDARAASTSQSICESISGVWKGSTPDEIGAECWTQDAIWISIIGCEPGQWAVGTSVAPGVLGFLIGYCKPVIPVILNYGMERKGICKLVSIEDGYLGGTITATIKGSPSVLKLKADGKTYVLPLVPGSVVFNGDGTSTAQFYTLDPVTGQALVPAGDYTARCHGTNGSNDGGSANTVSISY